MALVIREAVPGDAGAMALVLNEIIAIGGTTAYRQPFNVAAIQTIFIAPQRAISCMVALDATRLVGFQSLEWCDPDWPGEDPLPADWTVISTYVDPHRRKSGVGRALFEQTTKAARQAGVRFIAANIRRENQLGQAYYQGVGFSDFHADTELVVKRFAP